MYPIILDVLKLSKDSKNHINQEMCMGEMTVYSLLPCISYRGVNVGGGGGGGGGTPVKCYSRSQN